MTAITSARVSASVPNIEDQGSGWGYQLEAELSYDEFESERFGVFGGATYFVTLLLQGNVAA